MRSPLGLAFLKLFGGLAGLTLLRPGCHGSHKGHALLCAPCTGEDSGGCTGTGKGHRGALHSSVQYRDITNGSKPVLLWHFSVPEGQARKWGSVKWGFRELSAVTDHEATSLLPGSRITKPKQKNTPATETATEGCSGAMDGCSVGVEAALALQCLPLTVSVGVRHLILPALLDFCIKHPSLKVSSDLLCLGCDPEPVRTLKSAVSRCQ